MNENLAKKCESVQEGLVAVKESYIENSQVFLKYR